MIKDGHVKVNRYYENYNLYPDNFIYLVDEEIYYEQATRQYKVKFYCGECNKEMWFCYKKSDMSWLLSELDEGILCEDCGNAINPHEEGGIIGMLCVCK